MKIHRSFMILFIGLFLVSSVFLFVYTCYLPWMCLSDMGYNAISYIQSFEIGLVTPTQYKVQTTLHTLLRLTIPIMCLLFSVVLKRKLRMKLMAKIGRICGYYALSLLVLFSILLWLHFEYVHYEGAGFEVVIGWVFYFVAIA